MPTHQVFIGIGSNIGKRLCYLQEAVDQLACLEETSLCAVSSVYMTEPIGVTEQNRFFNGVILLETGLAPEKLRQQCKTIEQELGRPVTYPRWSSRVIDLDILLYDNMCLHTETLVIPHPELHRRKFVLVPLLDIANPVHPVMQQSIRQILECCDDRSVLIRIKQTVEIKKKQTAH
ncbi:MAG: 2-amino-4-hydroxy-6-hydroxymethyldihydropteridine diphosphokinase [Chlorobium sp.]|nr:MAG: 2-amino-4-hydroxy-6-hydroxymethyldihydropteridine diphosphokinase [Chlorobium sp.]